MNPKWLSTVSKFTIGWIASSLIWEITRGFSFEPLLSKINIDFPFLTILPILLFVSLFAGVTFGSVQYFSDQSIRKIMSFRATLLKGLIIHVLIMVIIYLFIYISLRITGLSPDLLFIDFLDNPIIIVNLIYSILTNSVIVIVLQINKLLGNGNLLKLITGKFYTPREEFRVFMFLDLKSSTSIAEKLGHIKYSRFIQDCFFDLSVIEKYKAEVYQYVGDEVVLTWKIKKNHSIDYCLDAFFAYTNQLKIRSDYYQSTYNCVPFFKAGTDLGMVTVVEVGTLKREIAYHGDTLNIAARIQEQCKVFDKAILISGAIHEYVHQIPKYEYEKMKETTLRGKENSTSIFSVSKK
ncbi:adenylate cyclase [Aquimarina sp. EL_43]|uniref:adenylate/guanylate cyclase domain-containing protein n=1 Tax=unclassified Aquimarina TaxID=2627091 RepID=UPI0018CA3F15|nr:MULTISPECIES: adenylate/guanylate cyclase domain-containing protein [unclassified Aquimarina]MBG6133377.1 adenylate cyclase [Aquimarina sp. EL_35]MBG6153444.1 adenylate cyclase [Aquimarina sp. EL_32]MBG6171600.1 adenylate cyclase [Aquimarina sp. EL_43]